MLAHCRLLEHVAHSGRKQRRSEASVPSVHFKGEPQHLPWAHSDELEQEEHSGFLKHLSREACVSYTHLPLKHFLLAHSKLDLQGEHSARKQRRSEASDPSVHFNGDPQHFPCRHCELKVHGEHSPFLPMGRQGRWINLADW